MRPRWILPVVLVAAIITAAAGVAARAVYTHPVNSAPTAVLPNDRPLAPDEEPGSGEVTATTDATAHPLYETVHGLLQTYFDAINGHHYDQWRTVVSARRAKLEPEQNWRRAYGTSRDGSIIIYRIESGPTDSARVLLGFTSTQNADLAPPELPVPCIRWKLVFPITHEDGAWKLDSGPTSSAPQHEPC